MDLRGLVLLLSGGLFFSDRQGQVQVPTLRPELIAGPWETVSATGVDGVFFQFVTSSAGPSGSPQIAWQTVDIRVYHRAEAKETWGWFAASYSALSESYGVRDDHALTEFDGNRLRIHFPDTTNLNPFDLDITFSPGNQTWTGTWWHAGQTFDVLLERPDTNGRFTPSGYVGDWQGEANTLGDSGSLHIRESQDGVLCAWLDRTTSGTDTRQIVGVTERHGEFLQMYSIPGTALILEIPATIGPAIHFRGKLSEDRQVITGRWSSAGGGGLSAPDKFRRVL
jgi:hypothetical protein